MIQNQNDLTKRLTEDSDYRALSHNLFTERFYLLRMLSICSSVIYGGNDRSEEEISKLTSDMKNEIDMICKYFKIEEKDDIKQHLEDTIFNLKYVAFVNTHPEGGIQ